MKDGTVKCKLHPRELITEARCEYIQYDFVCDGCARNHEHEISEYQEDKREADKIDHKAINN